MSFSSMLEILQEKNKESVVLIKLGVFYVATGKDAVFFVSDQQKDVLKPQVISYKIGLNLRLL